MKLTVLSLLLFFFIAVGSAARGAVWTTIANGQKVNGNIYASGNDVYLNGGPLGKCRSIGLGDGDYYFQVTDPNGSTVLSTDNITERKFTVLKGIITNYLGSTHLTSIGPCSSVTVALAPFTETSNDGGVFKVWVTSVASYEANGGFSPANSKTDNFKVNPDPTTSAPITSLAPITSPAPNTELFAANYDGSIMFAATKTEQNSDTPSAGTIAGAVIGSVAGVIVLVVVVAFVVIKMRTPVDRPPLVLY